MHGSLALERHNRIEYPRLVQQMQKRNVIENMNCYLRNDDESKSRQSSASSLKSNYSFLFLNNSIALLVMSKFSI